MAEAEVPPTFSAKTLYELSVTAVADKFLLYKKYLTRLPGHILFDLYYQLYQERRLCLLGIELSNLKTFCKMLRVTHQRIPLLLSFQALMDHGTRIGTELVISYNVCCLHADKNQENVDAVINLGLGLGAFLSDAAWFFGSEQVLLACMDLCLANNKTPQDWCRTLDCCHLLLHTQSSYLAFRGATETYHLGLTMVKQLEEVGYEHTKLAALFTEISGLFFSRSEYDEAYKWSRAALTEFKPSLPRRVTIDVLRQAAKSCVLKREFEKAGILIRQAVYLAREVFGTNHPKYSDVLMDYGFYLWNSDSIDQSAAVYQTALNIRKAIFGKTNLHVALAHENLAYVLYVKEYNSGNFQDASEHVRKAIDIMEKLLADEHLMLASAKRVKALILEEIALGNASTLSSKETMLHKSEGLHLSALNLVRNAFGERNVLTAKHYGNIGRLYQSMQKFQTAEAMHLKAISIKEELLGPDDYELGLSLGHLASLYNFHMKRYREAEKLYCRSIAIHTKLFGKSYSGLEYDYRGLLRVYTELDEYDKVLEFTDIFNHWRELRDRQAQSADSPLHLEKRPQPLEEVINAFLSM